MLRLKVVTFNVLKKLPPYKLRLLINENEHVLYRICISRGNDPNVIQILNFYDEAGKDREPAIEEYDYSDIESISEDINLDGYNDLKIMCTWGGAGRSSYRYRLIIIAGL